MCERFREYLKWWPDCGYTERTDLVAAVLYALLPWVRKPEKLLTFEKPTPENVGFFVYARRDYPS